MVLVQKMLLVHIVLVEVRQDLCLKQNPSCLGLPTSPSLLVMMKRNGIAYVVPLI